MGSYPAVNILECALGRYSSGQLTEWQLPADFDVHGAVLRVSDGPDVWTDGSLVDEKSSGVSSAGAGCFTFRDRRLWSYWNWVIGMRVFVMILWLLLVVGSAQFLGFADCSKG